MCEPKGEGDKGDIFNKTSFDFSQNQIRLYIKQKYIIFSPTGDPVCCDKKKKINFLPTVSFYNIKFIKF